MFRWIATFILLWFIYQVRHVFPPIIVGGIIAYLVLPVVQALSQRARIPIGLSTAAVYLFLAGVLISALWFLGPAIIAEAKDLASPDTQKELVHKAVEQLASVMKWQGNIDIDQTTEQILNGVVHSISRPEELQKGVGEVSHLLLSLLVCVVSSIYFTLDSQSVGRFFLRYVPQNRQTSIIELFGRMNKMLSKYVQGQIFLIVMMSSVAWLFLHFVIHMRYALPVAVFSGFLEIIPVLGPIIATSTATIVGIAQFGPAAALAIVVFYTLARWIEDYVVVPKVIGHAVELHPLAVIFAVLCGETLAGGLGMLIAIPVAACIKLILDFFYTGELPEDRKHKKKKEGKGQEPKSPPPSPPAQEAKTPAAAESESSSLSANVTGGGTQEPGAAGDQRIP